MLAISYLIFVPWKKGPELYLKISPYIYYCTVYTNYIILPLLNILLTIIYSCLPSTNLKVLPQESWVIFVTVINVTRLIEYYSSLKKIVFDDARIYLETRRLKQERNDIEELVDESNQKLFIEMKNNECTDYLKRIRIYGEGDVRVGSALRLKNDIYSIGFIVQIRNDIMDEHLDINQKKLDRALRKKKKAMRFHPLKK